MILLESKPCGTSRASVSSVAARGFAGCVRIRWRAAGKRVAAISLKSLSRIAPKTSVMGAWTNSSRKSRRARAPAALCAPSKRNRVRRLRRQLKPSGVLGAFEPCDDGRAWKMKAALAQGFGERDCDAAFVI